MSLEVMRMFEVKEANLADAYLIWNKVDDSFLHSNGNIFPACPEWWPTRELAQAVLDKYQPKHVWEHGDVFEGTLYTMMFLHSKHERPTVVYLNSDIAALQSVSRYLENATFLFNIREKL